MTILLQTSYGSEGREYWYLQEEGAFDPKEAISWLSLYVSEESNELHILNFETREPYRGQKIGWRLLQTVAKVYADRVQWVTLDDCSGRNPPRNIYYKLGFKLENSYGRWVDWYESSRINGPERRIAIADLESKVIEHS